MRADTPPCLAPVATYDVYMPVASNAWRFSVRAAKHYYRSSVNGGAHHDLLDPMWDWWLDDHWAFAMVDLTPLQVMLNGVWVLKPPRQITWCSDITWQHKEFHAADFDVNYWANHVVTDFVPVVEGTNVPFSCDNGLTTQAAVRASKDEEIQDQLEALTNARWQVFLIDPIAEQNAYASNWQAYTNRVDLIGLYWPKP